MLHPRQQGVNRYPGRVNAVITHPRWNQEYNQSYPVRSNPMCITHINRGLGHTARGTKGLNSHQNQRVSFQQLRDSLHCPHIRLYTIENKLITLDHRYFFNKCCQQSNRPTLGTGISHSNHGAHWSLPMAYI